jgi:hypothetical protein
MPSVHRTPDVISRQPTRGGCGVDDQRRTAKTIGRHGATTSEHDPFRKPAYFAYAAQKRPTKHQRTQPPTHQVPESPQFQAFP